MSREPFGRTSDEDAPARGRTYRILEETVPGGHTNEVLLDRLNGFEAWCADAGISTAGTRIDRYRRYLENSPGLGEEIDKGIFLDPPESPMRHGLDRYLYVLREVHELTWISQSLRAAGVKGIATKLSKVVSGADFAALDRNSESRNTQFELRIASYFSRAGFRLDLDTLTDVVATKGRITYHVECKRIASEKQLVRRLREAVAQLRLRMPPSTCLRRHVSLVAADVTKVAFRYNGVTMAMTPEHSRDVIQEKLVTIGDGLRESGPIDLTPACALWLQVHIPSLILTPPAPVTRFSNYVMANLQGGRRLQRASDRFWRMFVRIDTSEPGDEPAQPLQRRTGIRIPEGLRIAPDTDLLQHIVSAGERPDLPDEHVVLSVLPPGGGDANWQDFSFFEFRMMFDALAPEERIEFTSAIESGMRGLLGRLLLQRYPFRGVPAWLDGAP